MERGNFIPQMLSKGYSLDTIQSFLAKKRQEFIDKGRSQKEVDKFFYDRFGVNFAYDAESEDDLILLRDGISKADTQDFTIQESIKRLQPKAAQSWGDYFQKGWENSTTSLFFHAPDKSMYIPEDAPLLKRGAAGLAQAIGDLPTAVFGGIVGGSAGPVGALAGAGAATEMARTAMAGGYESGYPSIASSLTSLPGGFSSSPVLSEIMSGADGIDEAIRTAVVKGYARGSINNIRDFASRAWDTAEAGIVGAAVGGAAGYAGGLAKASASFIAPSVSGVLGKAVRSAAQPAVEVATMTATSAALEGRVPTKEDMLVSGLVLGGLRLGGFYTSKLAYSYAKDGLHPNAVLSWFHRNPGVKEDILSGNMDKPKETGGNYQPIYRVVAHSGEGQHAERWGYLNKRTAQGIVDGMNKKKGGMEDLPGTETTYELEPLAVDGSDQFLWIRSKNDPNITRLYAQFWNQTHLKTQQPPWDVLKKMAQEEIANPSETFIAFLQHGRPRIGPDRTPVEGIIGLRVGERVLVFQKDRLLSGDVLRQESKPMEIAAQDIAESIVTGFRPKGAFKKTALHTYSSLVDKFQALNQKAPIGDTTASYQAARLFMGIDGLVQHWLTVGRTALTREVTGNSLQSILKKGAQSPAFHIDEKVTEAVGKLGIALDVASEQGDKDFLAALRRLEADGSIDAATRRQMEGRVADAATARKLSPKDPLWLFRVYLTARHAKEMEDSGIEHGLDKAAVQSIVENKELADRFSGAAEELYQYQKELLKYRQKSGLISQKTYKKIITKYPDYVPFQRVMEAEENLGNVATGTYRMFGSSRDILDPLESVIQQTYYTLREAEKNRVLRLIAAEYGDVVEEGKQPRVGTLQEFREQEAKEQGAHSGKTISYREKGAQRKATVPVSIWEATQQLDPVSINAFNGLVTAAAKVAGVLRAGAILHPQFGLRNLVLDQFAAAINSDSGYKAFFDFGKGLEAIISHKTGNSLFPHAVEYYDEWLRHGGSNANLVSQDRVFTQEMIQLLLKSNNVQNSIPFTRRYVEGLKHYINPLNWGKGVYHLLQDLTEGSEVATRLGEYIRARQSGVSPEDAAYRSREVTMDFARMGASMKALNAMSAFLNAKVQGADRSIRQIMAHPTRTMARITAGVILPSMLLALVQQDILHNDPDSDVAKALQQVPNWQRKLYWLVPTEVGIFRIPKPHEYGAPFANPIESFISFLYDKEPEGNFLQRLYDDGYFGAVAEQFLLDWNTIVSSTTPTATLPVIEVLANHSTFRGTPIIIPSMENRLPETRYNRDTTELAKSISYYLSKIDPFLNSNVGQRLISPPSIDYMMKAYTGTLGDSLWRLLDVACQKAGILEEVNKPTQRLSDLPFIRSFMVRYPDSGSKSVDEFMERIKIYDQRIKSINFLLQQGTATAQERALIMAKEKYLINLGEMRKVINQLSKEAVRYHHLDTLTPEEKRHYIDTVYLQMIEIANEGLKIIRKMEGTGNAHQPAK